MELHVGEKVDVKGGQRDKNMLWYNKQQHRAGAQQHKSCYNQSHLKLTWTAN